MIMKKHLYLLSLLFLTAVSSFTTVKAVDRCNNLTVMSFNVRYDNPADSMNNWRYRSNRVADAINFYAADIVGTQEVLHNQLNDLRSRLNDYDMVGVGREDGKCQGEYAALWYRKDRFEAVDTGNFWLSATPDIAGSMGWDGACVRIATWALLRDKSTGKELLALNTHLDHVGVVARREGISLILERIASMRGTNAVVMTGDFNSTPDSDVLEHILGESTSGHLTDTRLTSPVVYGPSWSYHEFGTLPYDKRVLIDYVFIGGPLKAMRYGVLSETRDGLWLSDHCPVLATMSWK